MVVVRSSLGNLELAKELGLLFVGLELAVSEFGGRVDELESDFLKGVSARLRDQRLPQCNDSLPRSNDSTFDHQKVLMDDTIVREPTHWGDLLFGQIKRSRSGICSCLSYSINLLVDFGSVMISILTSARDRPLHPGWMPSSNTSHFSESLVSLSWESRRAPTGRDTLISMPLRDSDKIDHLILIKDGAHWDRFFKQAHREINFLGSFSSIYLNLHDMGFLLSEMKLSNLGVSNHADDRAIFFHPLDLSVNRLLLLVFLIFQGIFSEGLLLRSIPILVEASFALVGEMLGPNGGERAHPLRGFDITHHPDDVHRRCLQDRDRLHHLLLVQF